MLLFGETLIYVYMHFLTESLQYNFLTNVRVINFTLVRF